MRYLAWAEFDRAVCRIADLYRGRPFVGVYGFPRGGLCLAAAVSHHTGLPLLTELKPGCLAVDDIYETGVTLSRALEVTECECMVWISKAPPVWWHAVEVIAPPDWVVFPWENPNHAIKDEAAYRAARQ
jgi:xanthine phosphoribosyltransferase